MAARCKTWLGNLESTAVRWLTISSASAWTGE
jgi:hypothetical protein